VKKQDGLRLFTLLIDEMKLPVYMVFDRNLYVNSKSFEVTHSHYVNLLYVY